MMREWIAVHGSHDQRERLAAGMLPFKSTCTRSPTQRSAAGTPHAVPTDGATRLQEQLRQLAGPRRRDRHAERSVGRHASAPDGLGVQWALVNEIRSVMPDAQVQLRERSLAWTRDPHAPKLRLVTALVTTKVVLLLLRREFHVPDSAPDAPARTQEDELMKA